MKHLKLASAFALLIIFISSCKKEDQVEQNDEELITTVELRFSTTGSNTPLVFRWEDNDGPGGTNPQIAPVILSANTAYTLNVLMLDESKTPAVNITDEVMAESDEHRLYIIPAVNLFINQLIPTDRDNNGRPLGLTHQFTTTSAATGTLRVVLKHYGDGGKEGTDPVDSPKSSSDVDVQFPVTIQ